MEMTMGETKKTRRGEKEVTEVTMGETKETRPGEKGDGNDNGRDEKDPEKTS